MTESYAKFNVSLRDISYPVYQFYGDNDPQTDGTISFTYTESFNVDSEVLKSTLKIIDDKSIPEATLGLRRLRLLAQGVKLAKIGKAVFFLADLVKMSTKHKRFIDSEGRIFNYEKTRRVKLTFIKIAKVIPIKSGGAIIEVEGITSRFKCLFEPQSTKRYAGILKDGMSNILYGFYDYKYKDTWRKI